MSGLMHLARNVVAAVAISSTLLTTSASIAQAAGPGDPPPVAECMYLYQEGRERIYPPLPVDFRWRCSCHPIFSSDGRLLAANCSWKLIIKTSGASSAGYAYSSSTYGCLYSINNLVSEYIGASTNAGAGELIAEHYPCDQQGIKTQPPGELRDQAVLEYYSGSAWHPCSPLGYTYNTITTYGISNWWNMGSVPDCGNATYRLSNTVGIYEGGAWRGGTRWAPSLYMN